MSIVMDMSHADYLSAPGLSASALKALRKSPAHYYGQFLDPAAPQRKSTPAMAAGSLLHMVALQPELVDAHYLVRLEGLDARTKAGREWAASVPAGMTIITSDQLATAQAQAASLRRLPEVLGLMSLGYPEVSAFWSRYDIKCKCRHDWLSLDYSSKTARILEVKTCQDASPDGFAKAIGRYFYDLAAAWYIDGTHRATGCRVTDYIIAAVESEWPHVAACYRIDPVYLEAAHYECDALFDLYAQCVKSGKWPGYADSAQTIGVTRFERKNEEIEVEYV